MHRTVPTTVMDTPSYSGAWEEGQAETSGREDCEAPPRELWVLECSMAALDSGSMAGFIHQVVCEIACFAVCTLDF